MNGFDYVNNSGIDKIGKLLNINTGRMRSFGPCPCCGEMNRGNGDNRLALGVTPNGNGWQCHKCKTAGNLSDLVCYVLIKSKYVDAPEPNKKIVLDWLDNNGFGSKSKFKTPNIKTIDKVLRKNNKKVQKVDTTSPFRWEINIWNKHHENLINDENHEDVLQYLLNERKLSIETINSNLLGSLIDNKNNKWLVIPLKNEKGAIVSMKFRSMVDSQQRKKLKIPKYKNCIGRPLPLFGSHNLITDPKEFIIIVEGELDVLAMEEYGFHSNCVSGTSGAATNWPDEWLNILEKYQGFFLWYDNDEQGRKGAEKLASKLGKFRTFSIDCNEFKDVSECLMNDKSQGFIQYILSEKIKPYIETSLKRVDDYANQIEQLILNPNSLKGLSTGSNKLDPLIGGIRPGLWVVSGDTGHGKTTFLTWLLFEQAKRHIPVMVTSFEQRPIGTVQKLLRCEIGNDFTKVDQNSRRQALQLLGTLPIHLLDHYGELSPDKVIEAIRFSVRRHDIKIALVDHLGFLVRATETKDERQSIEQVVRELATIAVQDGITIMLVCHPNNTSVSQQRRVKITDLKGASAIRQDAHVGIIVERNDISKDAAFPTTTLWIDKVRSEFGQSGSSCTLAFDPLSCVYGDDWDSTPSGKAKRNVIVPS